jgi:hypothetical protein
MDSDFCPRINTGLAGTRPVESEFVDAVAMNILDNMC